ncbi:hypothetical protein WR25_20606 [Diploscapter pachys]|uniref:Uncharacterized protein n=1 Tax=Diploscapter pachys TaxID=2018661 RepID=A0A2A2K4W5_9BILA|nr:hypothetical protein WR25_20606 [Diploscapter pachys]
MTRRRRRPRAARAGARAERRPGLSATEEGEQVLVDHVSVGGGHAMGNCARLTLSWAWRSSNTDLGSPPGLLSVWTINGGTAAMMAALGTLSSGWRAM